jgi:DnaJ-class molecular chaperone
MLVRRRLYVHGVLLLVIQAPSCVRAFFEEFFGGGGGGGQRMEFQMGGQQVRPPKWPRGVTDSISKPMSWLKGTEWKWNNDGWSVKLTKEGDVDAPIQQCQGGRCKWSAESGKLYLLMGDAGLHELDTEPQKPADMKGMRMKGRRRADGSKLTLKFDKIFDHDAVDLDKDLYGALGVPDDADDATIKKAYKAAAKMYHPDKNPDAAGMAKFNDIRDAYEILNDPDKKSLYDTGGLEAVKKADKGQIEKTDDFESSLDISLDELYLGGDKIGQVQRRIVCRGCHLRPDAPQCQGCGRCPNEVKTVQVQMGPFLTQQQQEVPSKQKCKQVQEKIDMQIEKGMRDGDKLTFNRMADQRPGMLPGNVILTLKTTKHAKFKRMGDDLHMSMQISLRESLLGWAQTIRHIDGHTVELSSDSVTKHLQIIRVKGEGMPLRDDPATFGDLIVKVNVVFPTKLDKRQRDQVAAIFEQTPPRNEL